MVHVASIKGVVETFTPFLDGILQPVKQCNRLSEFYYLDISKQVFNLPLHIFTGNYLFILFTANQTFKPAHLIFWCLNLNDVSVHFWMVVFFKDWFFNLRLIHQFKSVNLF